MSELANTDNVALPLVVTDAGREAAIAADDDGLQLSLVEIALGDGLWQPDGTASGLQNEIKRLDNLGGGDVAADMLHLSVTDDSTDAYLLGEFGLYTDTGILFAIYSQDSPISEKISESILLVSADIKVDTVPPGSVTIDGNNFQYPPASENSLGVSEIATQEEVDGGEDGFRIVVPAKLKAWWDAVRVWDNIKDKPDTYPPSSHTHPWDEVTDKPDEATRWPTFDEVTEKPSTYPPSSHTHPWDEVTEKPSTFPPSSHTHDWSDINNPPESFLPGMILMWAGEEGDIPDGWQLCNGSGTTSNGIAVPDLRDRMIVCAGDDYDVGDTGGSKTATTDSKGSHSHTVTVDSHTLTESQMPTHMHGAYRANNAGSGGGGNVGGSDTGSTYNDTTPTGSSQSHNHTASSASTGSHSHTVSTLSPYYALAFIIKL